MKIAITVVCTALVLSGIIFIPHAFAENVPEWVKNTAGWWADGLIDDSAFLQGIQYLIKEGIMVIPPTETANRSQTEQSVPTWVKNNAGWWADDQISEIEFVNSLQYLIKVDIMVVPQVEKLESSTMKTSDYPDWLINNPSWQAAKEFTDSPFDNFDTKYTKQEPTGPGFGGDMEHRKILNSRGFSGPEFSSIKPPDTYRIFTLGGSTTFGNDQYYSETWPGYLQQIFDGEELGVNVEVINAGIPAYSSTPEYQMLKTRLIHYQPDLVIMYDGWNDLKANTPIDKTIQNWKSVCKLGNEKGFETIIIVQPMIDAGKRVLTDYELQMSHDDALHQGILRLYVENFTQLNKFCTITADFRGIFDYAQIPIYFDVGHTTILGNQIIAENVFAISSPLISAYTNTSYEIRTQFPTDGYISNANQFRIYAVGADFSGRNFDGLDLRNAVFDKADLNNASFKDAKLVGARFVKANLAGISLSGHDLTNANLFGVDLSGKDLTETILIGADLSRANLSGVDLSGKDLTGTILIGVDLSRANLSGVDLSGKDLTGTIFEDTNLSGIDLSGKDLSGVNLTGINLNEIDLVGKDLTGTILIGVDLSGKDLTGTILKGADLTNANLSGIDLSGKDLTGTILIGADLSRANLSGVDLSGKDLSGTKLTESDLSDTVLTSSILSYADLSYLDLTETKLVGVNLEHANLSNANLSGIDMSRSSLKDTNLSNADLSHTNLSSSLLSRVYLTNADIRYADFTGSVLLEVDFTVIKDKNWDGVIIKEAELSYSNLEGMDFTGKDLTLSILQHAKLKGTDFSNDVILHATFFVTADLEDANFKGSDLAPKYLVSKLYKNMAHLADLSGTELATEICMVGSGQSNLNIYCNPFTMYPIQVEVRGNDLYVIFHYYCNFYQANLENTNFANSNLGFVFFGEANLSNAVLNGADLSYAVLSKADLTGANLESVKLDGAILDCKNHSVCEDN